jgi:cell envelope opacity-associated protein A
MMAESLESRKFERKPQFDLAIPVMAKNRAPTPKAEESVKETPEAVEGKMAFSLLTKKGKSQQVIISISPTSTKTGGLILCLADSYGRTPIRLRLCSGHAQSAASRERGAAAYQEPCSQL